MATAGNEYTPHGNHPSANPSNPSGNLSNYDTQLPDTKDPEKRESAAIEPAEDPSESQYNEKDGSYEPIKAPASGDPKALSRTTSKGPVSEDDLFRALSRRRTNNSMRTETEDGDNQEDQEINRLLSRMFGHTRQDSEEEKTRHVGVIFKHLTVRGVGLGAALQPTVGDFFLGLPRLLEGLFKSGTKKISGKPPVRAILNDFNGCIRPGEMLLVLGPPGSGCSTFLKVIGNQRYGYESIDGTVTYGGTDAHTMGKKYRGEILYNPEDDLHYATLKVKSTLSFALKTRTPGKESRKEGESREDYIKEFLRIVAKLFWIEHTMDTKVGNEFVRGVSGGEKKRVSIGEAMITKASTQCWDNSTKGLDASTALEYVQSLRALTTMAHTSTSVALYQAGESLYECFDKVTLIHEGHCAYFGPADRAAEYFKSLGFEQPDRWTTADFVTSVTDENERRIKPGWENRIPRTAAEFAEAFRKSETNKLNDEDIAGLESETEQIVSARHAAQTKATRTKNFTLPFHKQVFACTKRQFQVMIGDKMSLGGKWGGIFFQAVIIGTLFWDIPQTSLGVFLKGGVLFFMLLFNALLALAELTSVFDSRPILLKHKSFSFYRPSAYAIAQVVADVPMVLVQVSIFNLVVYFMASLQRTAGQFFLALLILFLTTMTMYSFFRAIGAVAGSLDVATRVTGIALQALILYTGYLIPPDEMRPWFGWLRWINPVQYGFEALMANEFHNLDIECVNPNLVPPDGLAAGPEFQSCALRGSEPGSRIVQGSRYIDEAFTYRYSHVWRNIGFICAFLIFFIFLTAVGMEVQKPNKGGGAVTIFKRGQAPKSVQKSLEAGKKPGDEESGKEASPGITESDERSSDSDEEQEKVKGVAKNDSIFTWQNVNYNIPFKGSERTLLSNVQGFVRPGKLTALMGSSGAGKTTLLNTLAQRIRFGVVTGDFLVDGKPLPKSFQRATGFAEQMDIHEPTATVREALQFSARLRQPREVPLQEKYDYCEKIIDLLEMRDISGAIIGVPGSGLNQEQRKRLTIAVELASKPELLLFLDEPTSGLDSGAAFNIVRFLRKLADAGQAILCTIHQPSSVLFEYFDILLLLKSGGRTVYFGELGKDSRHLIDYLEGNGAKKCPPRTNPAEYMLDAIGAGNPDYQGQDWGDVWDNSSEKQALSKEIESIKGDRQDVSNESARDDREYAMPLTTQLYVVVYRAFVSVWRSPQYIAGKILLHIVTGLFNSFTFYNLGNSQIDFQNRLFSCFMTLTIAPPLIQQLQPRYLNARSIFKSRELNSKIYSWVAFTTATILTEIPYSLIAGTIYWCCWYWGPDFPTDTFTAAVVWIFIMIFELYYVSFGQAIASFSPNELLASLLVPLFFTFVVSFSGVVVPYATLPKFWREWMYWVTPFHYLMEALLSLVSHDVPLVCDREELAIFNAPQGQDCESYVGDFARQIDGSFRTLVEGDGSTLAQCGFCQYEDGDAFAASFNVFFSHLWRDFGIMWLFIIFNYAVVFFCTWLYVQGGRKILRYVGPSAVKHWWAKKRKSSK